MERIGPYQIIAGPLAGGFGEVYKVFDRDSGDEFALKTLKGSFLPGSATLLSFRREIDLWMQIPTHPNIVRAIKAFEHGVRPYVVMEWVSGGSLAQGRAALKPKQPELAAIVGGADALEVLRQIATGMSHIHNQGLVHGDLKPGNIMLRLRSPQITDFGFARIVSSIDSLHKGGTLHYMAPELQEMDPNPLTDIYSAGVSFLEVLEDFAATDFGVREAREMAGRMCSAKPEQRPKSFDEIADQLAEILRNAPLPPSIPVHTGDRRTWGEKVVADALPDRQRFENALSKFTAGSQEAAIEELREIASGNPKMVDARIHLAQLLIRRGAIDEAVAHLAGARIHTDTVDRLLDIAGLFAEATQFEEAVQMLGDLETQHGRSPRSWLVRARVADRKGNLSDAIDAYRESVKCGGGSDVRYALALLLKEAGLIGQSIEEFSSIGRDDRDYGVKVSIMLARIFVDTGRYDDAINELRECLKRDIGEERAYVYGELGYCYKEQGLYEAAIKAYRSCLALSPNDRAAQEGLDLCLEAAGKNK